MPGASIFLANQVTERSQAIRALLNCSEAMHIGDSKGFTGKKTQGKPENSLNIERPPLPLPTHRSVRGVYMPYWLKLFEHSFFPITAGH